MGNIKETNIKNRTYYFFNDINIKVFDSSLIKIDKKSYKNIYNFGYITIKKFNDYKSINSVNSLYLTISKEDRYIQESNRNKYLVFTFTDVNKKILAKFTKLWFEIKRLIETINEGKKGKYENDNSQT